MRICQLVVAIMAAQLSTPSLAPRDGCGPVHRDIFSRWRFDCGRRGHENRIGTDSAPSTCKSSLTKSCSHARGAAWTHHATLRGHADMAADTSRLKVRAGMAAGAMLLAISSYNVLPTLNRAIHGEVAAIGLAVVQIAFTVILAIIPFVPGWDAGTRRWLTVAFMLVNGYFAYENAGHRHDGERTANKQHEAIVAELAAKQDALKKLGDFTVTEDSQIEIARKNADTADADKTVAKTSVNAARTQLAGGCDTPKKCKVIEDEVKRAEAEAKQKDEDARKAHEELQRLSGWRTLTKKAEPINTRVDELQRALDQEHVVSDTSSKSEAVRTIEALFIAAVIELGNRFGPEGIFKFIFFASGVPLFLSAAPVTADADSD